MKEQRRGIVDRVRRAETRNDLVHVNIVGQQAGMDLSITMHRRSQPKVGDQVVVTIEDAE